jgi:hypothetical protein
LKGHLGFAFGASPSSSSSSFFAVVFFAAGFLTGAFSLTALTSAFAFPFFGLTSSSSSVGSASPSLLLPFWYVSPSSLSLSSLTGFRFFVEGLEAEAFFAGAALGFDPDPTASFFFDGLTSSSDEESLERMMLALVVALRFLLAAEEEEEAEGFEEKCFEEVEGLLSSISMSSESESGSLGAMVSERGRRESDEEGKVVLEREGGALALLRSM